MRDRLQTEVAALRRPRTWWPVQHRCCPPKNSLQAADAQAVEELSNPNAALDAQEPPSKERAPVPRVARLSWCASSARVRFAKMPRLHERAITTWFPERTVQSSNRKFPT